MKHPRVACSLVLALTVALLSAGCSRAGTPTGTDHGGRPTANSGSATPPPTPHRVEDLSLQLTTPTTVRLTWGKPNLNGGTDVIRYGVATYIVLGGSRIFFHYVYVDSTAQTTTYSVPGLDTGTNYAFAVKAYNADNRDANYGNFVTTVTGVIHPDAVPAVPSLTFLRPTDVEGEEVDSNKYQELTFQLGKPVTNGGYGIAYYQLERRVYRDGGWHLVDDKTITNPALTMEYIYRPLTGGTRYEVRVRAVTTESGKSPWSDFSIHTVYRVDRAPAAPASPTVAATTETSVALNIERPATNGGYYIYGYWVTAEQYEGRAWKQVSHTIYSSKNASLTAVVKHLKAHTRYRFRVSAINYLGDEGAQSAYVTVTTGN